MLQFYCPKCNTLLQAPDEKIGAKFNCTCGQRLQVPPPPDNKTVLGKLPGGESDPASQGSVPDWVKDVNKTKPAPEREKPKSFPLVPVPPPFPKKNVSTDETPDAEVIEIRADEVIDAEVINVRPSEPTVRCYACNCRFPESRIRRREVRTGSWSGASYHSKWGVGTHGGATYKVAIVCPRCAEEIDTTNREAAERNRKALIITLCVIGAVVVVPLLCLSLFCAGILALPGR
jgi:hypothetical protein